MKKFFIIAVLVLSSVFIKINEIDAEEAKYDMSNSLPRGLNFLDVRHVVYKTGDKHSSVDIHTSIYQNRYFTLVMSEDMIGDNVNSYEECIVEIQEWNTSTIKEEYLKKYEHDSGNLYYVTFNTRATLVQFSQLPIMEPKSKNIMLYEGTIDNFVRFEDYLGPRKEKNDLDGIIYTDGTKLIDIATLMDELTVDGEKDFTYDIMIDNYTPYYMNMGVHIVKIHILFADKTYVYNLTVIVTDIVDPLIEGPNVIEVSSDSPLSTLDLLSMFEITDNISEKGNMDIYFEYNEYNLNKTIKGIYEAKIVAVDECGNEASKVFAVMVDHKNEFPVVGPGAIYLYEDEQSLSYESIKNMFSAVEGINNSNIEYSLINNSYNQTSNPGSYEITFNVKHKMTQNISVDYEYLINVFVLERDNVDFKMPALVLKTDVASNMTLAEIKDYIISEISKINKNISNVRIIHEEYTKNQSKSGTYYVYFNYDLNGIEKTDKLAVIVEDGTSKLNYLAIVLPIIAVTAIVGGIIAYKIYKKKKLAIEE